MDIKKNHFDQDKLKCLDPEILYLKIQVYSNDKVLIHLKTKTVQHHCSQTPDVTNRMRPSIK